MSLGRRLAKLETIASAKLEDARPTFWTPARIEQRSAWLIRLLESMPEPRAVVVYADLVMLPPERWSPLTCHVETMAIHATMGALDAYIGQGRPVALPEPLCSVLEAHPDAEVRSSFDCVACGFAVPARSMREWARYREEVKATGRRVDPSKRALLTTCPLCGATVTWQGFNGRRWRELWERQRAEMAAV